MTEKRTTQSERIKRAFKLARTQKPAYADFYGILEPLFLLQDEERGRVAIEPLAIFPEEAKEKRSKGMPLIRKEDFPIDLQSVAAILAAMETFIPAENSALYSARSALCRSLASHAGVESAFWKAFVRPDQKGLDESRDLGPEVDLASLLFIARSCLRPSIERTAEDLAAAHEDFSSWAKGYCPVCGSLPSLLYLVGDGERKAYCSWCASRWALQRFQCPSCDNRDHTKLGYLYVESEPQYRVHTCRVCKAYYKQIDARELLEEPYFPLEEWTTLHLDLIAQRAGWVQQPMQTDGVGSSHTQSKP